MHILRKLELFASLANSRLLIGLAHVVDSCLDDRSRGFDVSNLLKPCESLPREIEGRSCDINIVVSLRYTIGQWNGDIVASYPSLTFGGRIKQCALYEQKVFVNPLRSTVLVRRRLIWRFFELVCVAPIAVDGWAQYEVHCLILDLNISETL